jgi:hypothetical protein
MTQDANEEEQTHFRHDLGEIEDYGDPRIASYEGKKVPLLLWLTYITLPIWGIITLVYFWNGSFGWFDRGYWHELQIAANTVNGNQNVYMQLEKNILEEVDKEQAEKAN